MSETLYRDRPRIRIEAYMASALLAVAGVWIALLKGNPVSTEVALCIFAFALAFLAAAVTSHIAHHREAPVTMDAFVRSLMAEMAARNTEVKPAKQSHLRLVTNLR